MSAVVIEPPAPVVTWEQASAHLRLLDDDEKAYVEGLIAVATAHIDGPDGWLGRAIGVQTLEARFDNFTAPSRLRLPYPPILEVTKITWRGADRVIRTADPADYELMDETVETETDTPPWTGGLAQAGAIRVEYRAGYEVLPAPIRHAILIMVSDMFHQREGVVIGTIASAVPMSTTVTRLLRPFWVWRA